MKTRNNGLTPASEAVRVAQASKRLLGWTNQMMAKHVANEQRKVVNVDLEDRNDDFRNETIFDYAAVKGGDVENPYNDPRMP